MSDSNVDQRRQALLAAANIGGTPDAIKFIGAALQDKTPIVRQTAATLLGQLKSPEAIPYLKQALEDHAEVSFAAARSLVELGDPSGQTILLEVLTGARKDRPGFMDLELKNAKKKLSPAELAKMGVNEASGALLGPASMGIIAIEEAVGGAKHPKDEVSGRAIAAVTLAGHPDAYTRKVLEWLLLDKSGTTRAAAAKGLGMCGTPDTIDKLQPLLRDEHAAVRYLAAASIIKLQGARTSTGGL